MVVEVNWHCTLDAPPDTRITLDGHEPATPEGVETLKVKLPDNPRMLVTVTVLIPVSPAANETDEAEMLKSVTVSVNTRE